MCGYVERRKGDVGCEKENRGGMGARKTAETIDIRFILSWSSQDTYPYVTLYVVCAGRASRRRCLSALAVREQREAPAAK